jgi:hypothetical protein
MGILGDTNTGLSLGQFAKHVLVNTVSGSKPLDPFERHAPLSRYGTQHRYDKGLWVTDRAKEIGTKLKTGLHEKATSTLNNTVAAQKSVGGTK